MTAGPALAAVLSRLADSGNLLDAADRRGALKLLVDSGFDRLPRPGVGTLERWQVLSAVAACDLALVKLFEGHTDALSIIGEVDPSTEIPSGSLWGTWAAEAPGAVVAFEPERQALRVRLEGTKAWCSGAAAVTHGLITAWRGPGDGPYLVAVAMDQPQVRVTGDGWNAVGMAASRSVEVRFDGAIGRLVGDRGVYVDRPGFAQGGCGIAACWHGGAVAVGQALKRSMAVTAASGSVPDPHKLAALGAVDVALQRNAALLRAAARWIDAHPSGDARALALRVRAAADDTATEVLQIVGRALGAAPFCRDARYARLAADLPVFLRQSHGERDLAALGSSVAADRGTEEETWAL